MLYQCIKRFRWLTKSDNFDQLVRFFRVLRKKVSGFGAASRPLRLNFDWQESLLSNPISTLIFQAVMKLLTNPNGGDGNPRPGVMIPIPQYPLYSASLAEYNMDQVSVVLEALEKLLSIFCHFWILGILIFAQNSVCSSRRLWMRKTTTFRQCLVSTLLCGKKVKMSRVCLPARASS